MAQCKYHPLIQAGVTPLKQEIPLLCPSVKQALSAVTKNKTQDTGESSPRSKACTTVGKQCYLDGSSFFDSGKANEM